MRLPKYLLTILILFPLLSTVVFAEQLRFERYINPLTLECSNEFSRGDECTKCNVDEDFLEDSDWEWTNSECPEGYSYTEIPIICVSERSPFCCSENHSGSKGDCTDLLLDDGAQTCAFASDIDQCSTLEPADWRVAETNELCPEKYSFQEDDVSCNPQVETNNTAQQIVDDTNVEPDQGKVATDGMPIDEEDWYEFSSSSIVNNYILYPFIGLMLLGLILFGFALFSYIQSKRRDY